MLVKTLFLAALAIAGVQTVLAVSPDSPLHAIVNVDVKPADAAIGNRLLSAYIKQVRSAPGVLSATLILQAGSTNHFIIDERFDNEAAYHRVLASPAVVTFRSELYGHLGSPWDERVGHDVAQ